MTLKPNNNYRIGYITIHLLKNAYHLLSGTCIKLERKKIHEAILHSKSTPVDLDQFRNLNYPSLIIQKHWKPDMTILRINKKEKNFLLLDKCCLHEKELSWGAKGLHCYLMSLPQHWQIKVSDLRNRARNGRDSVRGLLAELEGARYISREMGTK